MSLPAGTVLGRYEIRSSIGAGGMGEVYLAFDTQLDRLVALKILAPEFISDEQRMGRFTQEAKAVSALNHPNIVTIYESGKTDVTAFIATEFVDGITLRQRMKQAPMRLTEILDISIQIAFALSAAHAAGIVHRDMKPENVMIRPDGYIKVLDFGLAKLTETKHRDAGASTLIDTEPGVVMGTAHYMSPEQARGLQVDARTDIWSLGVVIYEMCAARPPFAGATNSDVLAAILEREPPPLTRYSQELPESLEWIVSKSLNKEREERYQSAKELLSDLRKVKRREDHDAELERSTPPEVERSGPFATRSEQTPIGPRGGQARVSTGTAAAASTAPSAISSAEYIVREVKQHKRVAATVAAIALVVLVGAGWGLYRIFWRRDQTPPLPPATPLKLTTSGNVTDAAISPNGDYVVYATDDGESRTLFLTHVPSHSHKPISKTTTGWYRELSFSKDNNFIYYVTPQDADSNTYQLNQIGLLGGSATTIANLAGGPEYTFKPDGSQIAFVSSKDVALVVARSDGANEKKLAAHTFIASPTWSPDGKTIAFVVEPDGQYMTVVGISPETSKEEVFTSQKWHQINKVRWLSDGSGLLVSAQEEGSSQTQIWKLSYPQGEVTRLTSAQDDYSGLAVTSNTGSGAESFVTLQYDPSPSHCVPESGDAGPSTQVVCLVNRQIQTFDSTADGRIVYEQESGAGADIWIAKAGVTSTTRLTFGGANRTPSVSPDDTLIVFTRDSHIFKMDLDGGNAQTLTKSSGEANPTISADGNWVVYEAGLPDSQTLWKISINGSEPVRLTDHPCKFPAVSPDGKLIACSPPADANGVDGIALISMDEKTLVKFIPLAPTARFPVRWIDEGAALAYVDSNGGVENIWRQPISGAHATQLTHFKSGSIFSFDWSRDGKQLALARGNSPADVVLVRNFR